ncbi:hypothetical protein DQ04_00021110 [Trypanosoma grayi]|uniref:hypothetical protein n=1 Tax=Trypanosoma grayi TaxID=71804 RepID=UPI0004F3FE91|nr:hypothetical protein DQ04_00021110 [Trypanosoma grayi]KEG15613.1 hypothetical protein DQ04_00021110 [Trypanosoma grayi]
METIFSASELDGQHPFDAIKVQVCDVVRRLDAALGRPPFPNPSIEPCRALARTLVAMLRHVHQRNRIAALSACPEVNMTLPVLCASLTGGSEGRRPCPMLMELLLEALMYVHAVSAYPLHSTLKDAKEVLPHSPVTFRFFVVTGAIDVDSMRSFFGMPPAPTTEQQERNPATKRRRVTATKKNTESEKTSAADGEGTFAVPSGMLTAAFDVILPPDCMKVLLSLFNSTSKFQQAVGCDSELAARVLGVYGDHLLPTLRPTSLLRCLDVAVLDYFVDVVQMHGENMTLLTESVFMQIPMAEWNSERLTNLIHYCIGRKVRREEAFASLVVYVFLYKLLTAWETQSLPLLSIEEEAQLWIASLRTAQMVPFSTGTTPTVEEERLIKPLSVLAECVRRRHTISTVTAAAAAAAAASTEAHKSVGGIFHMLTTSLDAKVNMAPTTAAGGGTKRKKGGKKNVKITVPQQVQLASVDSMDHYCRWIAESLCLVLWLTPPVAGMEDSDGPWCIVESLATLLIPSTEIALQRTPQASTWESFLNFLLSALCMHASTSTTSSLGRTTAAALVAAVQATHRLECCCILTQRMPDAYTALWWPLSGYRVVIEAWLSGSPSVDRFYAPFLSASPTECVGLLLSMMDENRLRELVCLLLDVEQTAMILLPSLEKAAQQRDPSNPASVDGFTRLHAQLCCAFENRAKVVAEQQQKKEESKKAQLLSAVWQKKELMEKANAFEREAQKFRVAKEEEHARIQQIREDRQREKEQRRERERREWQERRQKALALIQEMAEKTRVERLAEQREKLLQYRERVASLSRMSSFLEGLQVAPSRIMSLLAALRPYLHRMTHDELLEYVVTGDREVPSDMRAADDAPLGECTKERAEETVYFSDEAPSFWDGVMQLVAKHSGEAIGNSHVEVEKEDVPCVPTGGPSFHKRVSAALDLFDYSVGADASLPDPLPSVNVRTASRMLGREVLANTGFVNGREALLACQQRGLCVLRDGVCTLTRLGFRYHFPFHDPDLVLDVQLERRRREARRKLAEMQFHEAGGEEEEEDEETMSSDTDGDEVRFTDEPV